MERHFTRREVKVSRRKWFLEFRSVRRCCSPLLSLSPSLSLFSHTRTHCFSRRRRRGCPTSVMAARCLSGHWCARDRRNLTFYGRFSGSAREGEAYMVRDRLRGEGEIYWLLWEKRDKYGNDK